MSVTHEAVRVSLGTAFSTAALTSLADGAASKVPAALWERALHQPLESFLGRPGKALRAELVEAGFRIAGGSPELPTALPVLLEALHAGSLIIDDIEDDSVQRRGHPSLHRSHGVPLALNAGCWLYFWTFELLESLPMAETTRLAAYRMTTTVMRECHYGQALDLSVRQDDVAPEQLESVALACSELKTGSLVGLATGLGALVGGASPHSVAAIQRYGRALGVGLQMLDDLSSLLSLGKQDKAEEDLQLGRVTWPWAWLARTPEDARWSALLQEALAVRAGAPFGPLVCHLVAALEDRGRLAIEELFSRAWIELETQLGATHELTPLQRCADRMKASYVSRLTSAGIP